MNIRSARRPSDAVTKLRTHHQQLQRLGWFSKKPLRQAMMHEWMENSIDPCRREEAISRVVSKWKIAFSLLPFGTMCFGGHDDTGRPGVFAFGSQEIDYAGMQSLLR